MLEPRPSDLSFYNHDSGATSGMSSPFWQVMTDGDELAFKNKRDRKVVRLDPSAPPGDNTARSPPLPACPEYLQACFLDHFTRRG